MSTITTLNDWITGASFRWQVNTNFANLNTDKLESTDLKTVNWNSLVWSGDIVISGGGSVATDTIWDAKWDLAGWTGANTASRLAVGSNWQVLTADSAEATGLKWTNPAGWWDALTSGTLAQFASTTSAQLATVISDETGSGWVLVFSNSPALTTPSIAAITVSGWVLTLPTGASGTIARTSDITGTNSGTNTGDETTWRINTLYGTTNAITVGSVEVWHASDATLSRSSAGQLAMEGVDILSISNTKTVTNKTMTGATNTITARLLKSATTEVDVSAATAPSNWQVLTATSSTTATWQTPSGWWSIRRVFAIAGKIWTTGTNVANTFVADWTFTISKVNLWYWTAWSGTLTVDVNKNWTTLFATTKPSITTTNQSSINSGTLTTTTLASGDVLTIDIDAVPWTPWTDLYVEIVYS